jgi:hypothetical protein
MSGIRVLVGTKKGAFILTSDGKRKQWNVDGPHFGGWELFHLKGSPADPDRLYASQTSSWFGQVIQRSDDGGKTWNPPGTKPEDLMGPDGMPKGQSNMFLYDASAETGKPLGAPMVRQLTASGNLSGVASEPSLTDPDTVYAGVEDAAIFKSTTRKRGKSWRTAREGRLWQPTPADCLHTIMLNSGHPDRIFVPFQLPARSGATTPKTWRPSIGLEVQSMNCLTRMPKSATVSRIAMHPTRPNVLFAKALGRDAERRSGESWHEISGNLPSDFGFPIAVHAHEPNTIYVVPIKSDSEHYPPDGKLRVYRSRTGGNEWEPLTKGLPQQNCYVNILRDAMAIDQLDPCGLYFGTTGGQVTPRCRSS